MSGYTYGRLHGTPTTVIFTTWRRCEERLKTCYTSKARRSTTLLALPPAACSAHGAQRAGRLMALVLAFLKPAMRC